MTAPTIGHPAETNDLKIVILYPEEARGVAAETVARVQNDDNTGCLRVPVMLRSGVLVHQLVRPVKVPEPDPSDPPNITPKVKPVPVDPPRWVAHAVEASIAERGRLLLRKEMWEPKDLAAAGLGLLKRQDDGSWGNDASREAIRRWLFDPLRDENDVLAVLDYAASSGVWCMESPSASLDIG